MDFECPGGGCTKDVVAIRMQRRLCVVYLATKTIVTSVALRTTGLYSVLRGPTCLQLYATLLTAVVLLLTTVSKHRNVSLRRAGVCIYSREAELPNCAQTWPRWCKDTRMPGAWLRCSVSQC